MAGHNYCGAKFKAQRAKALISLSNKKFNQKSLSLPFSDFIGKEGTIFKLNKRGSIFFSLFPIDLGCDRNINL